MAAWGPPFGLWGVWGGLLHIVAGGEFSKIFGSKNRESGGERVNTA